MSAETARLILDTTNVVKWPVAVLIVGWIFRKEFRK